MLFCGKCPYLEINEDIQDKYFLKIGFRLPHVCGKYNKRVLHSGHHPKIVRLKECIEEETL